MSSDSNQEKKVEGAEEVADEKLPSYENPPVCEVIAGVQFDALDSFSSAHIGAFWERIRKLYPNTADAPPLSPVLEDSTQMGIRISNVPPLPRTFFIDDSGNRLIQIQRDRFHHNWRKVRPKDVYPRYEDIREVFFKRWQDFRQFISGLKLGEVKIKQFELTYNNHILQGEGWEDISKIHEVFPFLTLNEHFKSCGFLKIPDRMGFGVRFPCSPCRGNLHVTSKHGFSNEDKVELFVLEVTVRGNPVDDAGSDLESWFDTAREWIVRGFSDLTGEEAQKSWRRIQ